MSDDPSAQVRELAAQLGELSEQLGDPRGRRRARRRSSPARRPSWSARPATRSIARCARPRPTTAEARRWRTTRTTCGGWSTTTSSELAVLRSRGDRRPRRGDALLAARRRQADPAGALPRRGALGGHRPGRGAAGGGGDRAHPHLLADPRRPAGDGRRRAAPRAADLARRLRRGRRDPRRRRPLRGGDPALLRAPGGRARTGCSRRSPSSRGRPGWGGWSAASTSTSPPTTDSTPRGCASCTR